MCPSFPKPFLSRWRCFCAFTCLFWCCQVSFASTSDVHGTQRMASDGGAAGVVQRDPWASSTIGAVATGAEFKSASDGGAQRVNHNAHDVRGSFQFREDGGRDAQDSTPMLHWRVPGSASLVWKPRFRQCFRMGWTRSRPRSDHFKIHWQRPSEAHKRLPSRSR